MMQIELELCIVKQKKEGNRHDRADEGIVYKIPENH